MRLVTYTDGIDGRTVELHPLMTIISGLDEAARARLVTAVSALPGGQDPGAGGQIEVHGICLDLNQESLELLELSASVGVVLRPEDLPGLVPPAPTDTSSGPESSGSSAADRRGDAADPFAAALADAMAASSEATRLDREIGTARAELDDLVAERRRIAEASAQCRAHLDSYADAGLRVAQDALDELIRSTSDRDAGERSTETADLVAERAEIMGRLDQLITSAGALKKELRSHVSADPARVTAAHHRLEVAMGVGQEPIPEALDLAARLAASTERMATVSARRAGGRQRMHDLTARRDAAYDALVAATRNLRAPELDPQLVDELEAVHDEIFELDGKSSRLGSGKIRRRLLELKEHEATILGRLGFDTWSSYVMGVSSTEVDAERHRRYVAAKATYELAEDELGRAVENPQLEDPEFAAIEAEHRRLLEQAGVVLRGDPGSDPIGRLRSLRRPTGHSEVGVPEAADLLQQELFAVGASIPPRLLNPDELSEIAVAWLAESARSRERLPRLEADHDRIEGEISALVQRLETLPEEPPATVASEVEPDALAEARAQVAECEQRVRRHHSAEAELAELARRDAELVARVDELSGQISDLEARLGAAREAASAAERGAESERAARETERVAEEAVRRPSPPIDRRGRRAFSGGQSGIDSEAVEWYVLARLAQQRAVSFVGSVPMIVDNAFVRWSMEEMTEVFGRLARMSEVIQIIYLTDDDGVAAWARSLGSDRAAVIDVAARNLVE